jgi:predicted ATP-binding protein involved in virulence
VLGVEHPNTINIAKNFDSFMEKLNKLFFLNSKNSNLTFKIDKIEIKNFKQYKEPFSMEFSGKVNIVIGQNATGKTTLLQAIALGLLKDGILDARKLDYDKYISKNENEAEVIIGHNGYQKVVKIKKDGREIENNYFIPFLLAYGSNFFTKYNLSADKIVDDILNETIHKKIANSIFQDYVDEFWNPLTVLNELNRSDHKKAKKKRDDIFNAINSFLEGYKLVSEENRYFFKKDDDKTELYSEDLSEGYRGSVLLITDMLIKILGVGWTPKTIEGIVLIDEFDKHLHPRWQSKLVNQLTKTFPNIQFIMTTHNPMSILDRDGDEIIKLVESKDGIEALKGQGTKNIDASIVLLEYFGVESTVGKTMQENINNFNKLKLKKELTQKEQEELKDLEKFLGSTVASNLVYDRTYLKFLEFIRDRKEIDFDKYEKISDEEMDELLKDFGDFFND